MKTAILRINEVSDCSYFVNIVIFNHNGRPTYFNRRDIWNMLYGNLLALLGTLVMDQYSNLGHLHNIRRIYGVQGCLQ